MKQAFSFIMFFMLCTTNVFSQNTSPVLTDAEWETLFPYLEKENWGEVEKITSDYLKKFTGQNENGNEAAIVRYMYLSGVGGQLGDKSIDKDQAMQKVKDLKGKNVITPPRTFRKGGMFNFFSYNEDEKKWSKCFSNRDKTSIYFFEYFDMSDPATIQEDYMGKMEGKVLQLKGKVNEIKAEGYAMPRLRIEYSEVVVWDVIDE